MFLVVFWTSSLKITNLKSNHDTNKTMVSERPTFDSNENMMQYDFDVPDDLIERTATLLSLNQKAVSGVSTRDGKAIKLGTAGALAVWKAE